MFIIVGASTTPALGASAAPTFGATSTPAFGTTGLGTGGLNFGAGTNTSTAATGELKTVFFLISI